MVFPKRAFCAGSRGRSAVWGRHGSVPEAGFAQRAAHLRLPRYSSRRDCHGRRLQR